MMFCSLLKSTKIDLNPISLFLICLGSTLCGCNENISDAQIEHPTGRLEDRSIGTLELDSAMHLMDFEYVRGSDSQLVLTSYSPVDSIVYRINIGESSSRLDTFCKLQNYHRWFSQRLADCSVITLENETGQFTLSGAGERNRHWKFDEFAPQVVPNRTMKVLDDRVYVLNSSYHHDSSTLNGARAFYQEVRPILIFNVKNPLGSVRSIGSFPSMYKNSNKNISDFQPYFCVDDEGRCILSFGYSDSLIVVEEGESKSVKCKSAYYKEPSFLSFDDAESMSNQRRFYAEHSRYLGVFFNPIRNEYYRLVKHPSQQEAEMRFSIIVMTEEFLPIDEREFGISSFAPYPIIYTEKGFMLPNIMVSSQTKKPHFEHFAL